MSHRRPEAVFSRPTNVVRACDHPMTERSRTRAPTAVRGAPSGRGEASKAGQQVAGAVIEDGKITLTFGEPGAGGSDNGEGANPWDEVLQ
jgi:hypothetical protein